MASTHIGNSLSTWSFSASRPCEGLSLIELIVSIGLGLALASGLSLFYEEMASTNNAAIQESMQKKYSAKALNTIDFAIEHAGYIPYSLVGTPKEYVYRESENFEEGQAFKAESEAKDGALHVRTAGENNIIFSDCLGEDVTSNEIVEMGFYLSQNKLICKSTHITESIDVVEEFEDTIAENIELMRITQFGVHSIENLKYIIPPLEEKPSDTKINSLLLELVTFSKENIYHTEKTQILTYSDNTQFTTISRQKYALFSRKMNIFNQY